MVVAYHRGSLLRYVRSEFLYEGTSVGIKVLKWLNTGAMRGIEQSVDWKSIEPTYQSCQD